MFDTFTQKFPRDYTAAYTTRYDSSQKADNKVADETAWMCRLVWAFSLLLQITRLVFSVAVELLYVSFNHGTYKKTSCEIWLSCNMRNQTEL